MTKSIRFSKISSRFLIQTGIFAVALLVMCMPFVAHGDMLTRQLQLGMSGADVSSLQTFLAQDNTIYPQGLITGYFGSLTKSAVSNFQARNGIATVGRVGPVTIAAINAQMGNGSTVGTDNVAPSIYSLNLSTTNSSVTMNWNTSENSSAIVYYSTQPIQMTEGSATNAATIGGNSVLIHTDLHASHTATLTGLQANTTYYYVVYARDASGNETITWPTTFTTSN